ncbi:MAG: EamA family transporter [Micromonosporaceae bacterium]
MFPRPFSFRGPRRSAPARVTALSGAADILLAAALFGTTGTARAFAPSQASPLAIGAARIVVGGLLLFCLAARGPGLRLLMRKGAATWAALALGAGEVALYQVTFFAALARTGVAAGTVVTIGTAPLFTGLFAWLAAGTRPASRWMISTAAAVTGCAVLEIGTGSTGPQLAGIALALISGASYAAYAVTASRLITGGANDRAVIGVLFGGAALLLTPVLFAGPATWVFTGRGLTVVAYLGVFATAVSYVRYARGLRTVPVAVATTLGLAEPGVASLLGLALLHEHLSPLSGAGLVLLGAGLVILGPLTPRRPSPLPEARPRN